MMENVDVALFGSWGEQIFRTKLPTHNYLLPILPTLLLIGLLGFLTGWFFIELIKTIRWQRDKEKTIKELEWYINHEDKVLIERRKDDGFDNYCYSAGSK